MKAAGIENISPRFRLMVTGCEAIAAVDFTAASDLFTQALTTPGIERWPFDLARIRLLHGERLRRAGLTSQARAQLTAALETFQHLGAPPWISRALDELRATGQSRTRGGPTTDSRLTPQEHRVATLAARGLRNKEIAGQLSLSERTVAAHLHRVFPKLRVTSRAGLRDALAALPREETASGAGRAGAPSRLQGHELTGDARDEVLERPAENGWPNDELT
jgi:DNA-binding CsgD family transcriptional regulator